MNNLTPMQAAYWTGRQASGSLGKVAAHLYVEFDCGKLDPNRLEKAVRKLYESHDMMRMRITSDGQQHVGKTEESFSFEAEDLTGLDAGVLEKHLADKREHWTCRRLDLASGRTSAFGLSVLPGGACRLHVDTDMVAIDPPSFCVLMEDLARFYEDPHTGIEKGKSDYFDWLKRKNSDPDLARRHAQDKRWWQDRLADLPPAPNLPEAPVPQSVQSGRLAAMLSPDERGSLTRTARELRITPSALMLGLFAAVMGQATGDERFRLNVPMFWRAPYTAGVERLVGDFSNILILAADPSPGDTLGSLCKRLAERMLDLLAHSSYPGVSVMRDLSRARRSLQTAPVVFTSGLDLPARDLFSDRVTRVFGPMSWAVSQGPQVALDAQVAAMNGGILVNWDIRYDALPEAWINTAFETYLALARKVAQDPAAMEEAVYARTATTGAAGNDGQYANDGRYTEDMLRKLLTRLAPATDAQAPEEIRKRGLSEADLTDFVAFLNRYIPDMKLTLEDIGPGSTAASLAGVVRARSAGASEKVGQAYLRAIDARGRASPETQPAE